MLTEDFEVYIDNGRRKIICDGASYDIDEFCAKLAQELDSAEVGDYQIVYLED